MYINEDMNKTKWNNVHLNLKFYLRNKIGELYNNF